MNLWLLLLSLLIVLLPLQNPLAQLLVNVFSVPAVVALWKELLVLVLVLVMEYRVWCNRCKFSTLGSFVFSQWFQIVVFCLSVFVITQSASDIPISGILHGFRFELWFLFVMSVVVSWVCIENQEVLDKVSYIVSSKVPYGVIFASFFSILILLFGVPFLQLFGFGADSRSLTTSPIINVVDGGGWNTMARLGGGFSSPNHFAGYLLLVLPMLVGMKSSQRFPRWLQIFLISLILVFIAFSYARFAWLSLAFFGLAWLVDKTGKMRWWRLAPVPFLIVIGVVFSPGFSNVEWLPTAIRKPSSSTLHYRHTSAAFDIITQSPKLFFTGYGLGTSGPASRYYPYENNPLYTEHRGISYKWTLFEPDITIPESWYLQVLLNGGSIYFLGYLIAIGYPVWLLRRQPYVLAGLLALLLGNTALHVWENQTVALYWVLLILYGLLYKKQMKKL